MILGLLDDPVVCGALGSAARPDEDVLVETVDVLRALASGCPRALVTDDDQAHRGAVTRARAREIPTVVVRPRDVGRWEEMRRDQVPPPDRRAFYGARIRALIPGGRPTWVDRTLGEMTRAAGGSLPPSFVALARRVLEDPTRFTTLDELTPLTGLTPGALRARFRRRDLPSPADYLRWLRLLAVAQRLRDTDEAVSGIAMVLGFQSSGNLSRFTRAVVGRAPGSMRTEASGAELLVRFAAFGLGPSAVEGWRSLDRVFGAARRAGA